MWDMVDMVEDTWDMYELYWVSILTCLYATFP